MKNITHKGLLIALTYFIAIASILIGIFLSKEFLLYEIPISFIIAVIIFPYILITVSFMIHIYNINYENNEQVLLIRQQLATEKESFENSKNRLVQESRFLTALEMSVRQTNVEKVFLGYLISEWEKNVENIINGVLILHKDYWLLSKDIYPYAQDKVEVTSVVPIESWDSTSPRADKELIDSKVHQKLLINKGIVVNRTFIFNKENYDSQPYYETLIKIVIEQLKEGFHIYYINIDDYHEEDFGSKVSIVTADLALIDNRFIAIGNMSNINHNVYFYSFYDLGLLNNSDIFDMTMFHPALELFDSPEKLQEGQASLKMEKYRKSIAQFPFKKEAEKLAIASLIKY